MSGRYVLQGPRQVSFQVGAYDRSLPLVIDPVLSYSTYLGTANYDQANAIAVDSSGNVYLTGFTSSTAYPTTAGAYKTTSAGGGSDAFVTKLNSNGSSLVYSTYLGGNSSDQASSIAVDSLGNAYVTGNTISTNFPVTAGAMKASFGGSADAFVAKLSPDGSQLLYSTYLGGSGLDQALGIAVDPTGNIYVTGKTFSTNFPTVNPLQSSNKGQPNAFVTELSASGSPVYSTYLGGSGSDQGASISVDALGNAYVVGATSSSDFPTVNALQSLCMSCPSFNDAFVAEISTNGVGLVYSTFLGGSGEDQGMAIAVDAQSNAYVTGHTFSVDFPATAGAYQQSLLGGSSAFVTQIIANGSALGYSTYLGSDAYSFGEAIAVLNGNAYLAGLTHANAFPAVNATQSARAGFPDAFVAEVNSTGTSLYFSTYLGGNGRDEATGIGLDSLGNAYVVGLTRSTNFPTLSTYQATFGGGDADSFVTKIHVSPASLSATSLSFATQTVGTTSPQQQITVSNNGSLTLTITGVPITGANPSDFSLTTNCVNNVLSQGQSCNVQMTFAPTASGTRTATLSVAADSSGSPPQTVSLTGNGVQPVVTLSPTSLSFGNQQTGTSSSPQGVTLSNTGNTELNNLVISITGTNADQFLQSNNCGGSVAAGSTCTINATFNPNATGSMTAAVTFQDNASNSPQTVPLAGTGFSSQVNLSPVTVPFSSQQVGTTSASQTLTLSNPTGAAVTISSIAITGANPSDFGQTNNCGTSIAVGANCTINVTFTPSVASSESATLQVSDSATNSPQTASLTGTGFTTTAGLTPTSLTFASQQVGSTSAAQAVALT
ncbi:MAG: hypothetical protein DMG22_23445, partial [Acidobacteria bacterium]